MLTKQRIFEIINKADEGDKASRLFDGIIMSLICLSIVSIVLESFSSLAQNYRLYYDAAKKEDFSSLQQRIGFKATLEKRGAKATNNEPAWCIYGQK